MRRLTREELLDILYGGAIYGAGGGGDLEEGIGLIDDALAKGKSFDLVSVDEAPTDALVCTPYMLGAISEAADDDLAALTFLPRIDKHPILAAYERLENHIGKPMYGAIPCELGGSNTGVAMYAAAMAGAKIIDADPSGRAVPEVTHSGYYLAGLPAAPIVMANAFGEVFLAENVVDDARAETLVRALSLTSANDIAAIDHALPLSMLDGALVEGSLSMALSMGRRWRRAVASGADPAAEIAKEGRGRVVFKGRITEAAWRTEGGFTLGEISLQNASGDIYRIAVKNENLSGHLNNAVHATIPEIITLIDQTTGAVILNPDARPDKSAEVVVLPAPNLFLGETGLEVFGPSYAGIDAPFQSALK